MTDNVLKKRLLNNLILIISLIILLLFLHFHCTNTDLSSEPAPITDLDKSRVHFITLQIPGKPDMELIRHSEQQWQLVKPVRIEANPLVIDMLLNLPNSQSDIRHPAAQLELASFRLISPVATLKLGDAEFHFGDKDPIENKRYLLYNNTLYLINDRVLPLILSGGIGPFINPGLIPPNQHISHLQLDGTHLSMDTASHWQIHSNTPGLAPETTTEQLQAWIGLWEQQQAVYVQHHPEEINPETQNTIKLTLHNGSTIEYLAVKQNSALRLYRPDYKLLYHLDNATLVKLTSLP